VAAPFGLAIARLGCLAAGCCFGTVSSLPWAIRYPPGSLAANTHASLHLIGPDETFSLPVHPLQIYFLLAQVALGVFLLWFEPRKRYDGQVLLISLVLGQGAKAWLEGFRQPLPGVSTFHLFVSSAALAAAAAAALIVIALRTRRPAQLAEQRV
jgi:phosphatidylglycerol:prolipoprotein diacylglycerol transferase